MVPRVRLAWSEMPRPTVVQVKVARCGTGELNDLSTGENEGVIERRALTHCRFRVFYIACEELFAMHGGQE